MLSQTLIQHAPRPALRPFTLRRLSLGTARGAHNESTCCHPALALCPCMLAVIPLERWAQSVSLQATALRADDAEAVTCPRRQRQVAVIA